jgi:hypothetical protein
LQVPPGLQSIQGRQQRKLHAVLLRFLLSTDSDDPADRRIGEWWNDWNDHR